MENEVMKPHKLYTKGSSLALVLALGAVLVSCRPRHPHEDYSDRRGAGGLRRRGLAFAWNRGKAGREESGVRAGGRISSGVHVRR